MMGKGIGIKFLFKSFYLIY